jgi:hypothetical protein
MDPIQDARGWTHIDWELTGVTADQIDWFWSNMEKGFFLWHPSEHNDFEWLVPPRDGAALGAIHIAPQTWADGTHIRPHIRFEDVADLPADVKDVLTYDHVVIAAGIALFDKDYFVGKAPIAYRLHQWEKTDSGVRGRSSAIPLNDDPLEKNRGFVWAKHAGEEVANWEVFLPTLHRLYAPVKGKRANPFNSFRTEGKGAMLRYLDAHRV